MEYLKDIALILGILCLTFVIIPWLGMVIIEFFRAIWDENDRFD